MFSSKVVNNKVDTYVSSAISTDNKSTNRKKSALANIVDSVNNSPPP